MCVSMRPAEFSGTVLYCGRRHHRELGWIEVFGYQNRAANLAEGPNAMLLHLPAQSVSQEQFLPATRSERVLRNMVDAVRSPRPGGRGPVSGGPAFMSHVEVFEHDIYTVVLAANASFIPQALGQVEPRKRPPLNHDLFTFYGDLFPNYPVALCCFDNAEAAEAKPLLLWYRPLSEDHLIVPAIDCHTGAVPDLAAEVRTDHWVIFGTDHAPDGWGTRVAYDRGTRHKLLDFLPPRVMGTRFRKMMPNGDFAIAHDDLISGNLNRVHRLTPA